MSARLSEGTNAGARWRRALAPLVLAAVAVAVLPAWPASARAATPFAASFRGTFTITFLTGPAATHELRFRGRGWARHLGVTEVDGYSTLRPVAGDPRCNEIVDDEVTLTAADGSTLQLANEAVDCIEITPDGRMVIHGRGVYAISGGTNRFRGATGAGKVATEAQVTGLVGGGVTGTFDPLSFHGSFER